MALLVVGAGLEQGRKSARSLFSSYFLQSMAMLLSAQEMHCLAFTGAK